MAVETLQKEHNGYDYEDAVFSYLIFVSVIAILYTFLIAFVQVPRVFKYNRT